MMETTWKNVVTSRWKITKNDFHKNKKDKKEDAYPTKEIWHKYLLISKKTWQIWHKQIVSDYGTTSSLEKSEENITNIRNTEK